MSESDDINFELLQSDNGASDVEIQLQNENITEQQERNSPKYFNGYGLPSALRAKIKTKFTGVPLKEFDPYYQNSNTFVVISRGSRILYRFGGASEIVKSNGGWRQQSISILTHGVFNYFMTFMVLLNIVLYATLPFGSYQTNNSTVGKGELDSNIKQERKFDYATLTNIIASYVFILVYILEFVLKISARGFWKTQNSFSCLSISWSWLDIFVILNGLITLCYPGNLTLAAFNGFRALKLIPLMPCLLSGYDKILKCTIKSLLRLLIYPIVVFVLLTALSSHFYFGLLRQKCVLDGTWNNSATILDDTMDGYWSSPSPILLMDPETHEPRICGYSLWPNTCPENYTCIAIGENPVHGYVSFDTFSMTELTLLNLLVQDFPEFVYDKIWAAQGPSHILISIINFILGTFTIGAMIYAILGNELDKDLTTYPNDVKSSVATNTKNHDQESNGKFAKVQKFVATIVNHTYFDSIITCCILLDVTIIGFDHFELTNEGIEAFQKLSMFIFSVYLLEFIFKISALGISNYFKIGWNLFDFFLVCCLFLHINDIYAGSVMYYGVSLRGLKIVPRCSTLNFMFTVIKNVLGKPLQWAFGIYAIVIFIFAYIGYVRFGPSYIGSEDLFNGDIPRWNMISYWESFRSMFRSSCGEWTEIMWDLILVSSPKSAMLFMIPAGLIGNFLVKILGTGIAITTSNLQAASESEPKALKLTSLEIIFTPCRYVWRKLIRSNETGNIEQVELKHEITEDQIDTMNENLNKETNGVEKVNQTTRSGFKDSSTIAKILNHVGYRIFTSFLIFILSILFIKYTLIVHVIFIVYFGIELIARLICSGISFKTLTIGTVFDAMMIANEIVMLAVSLISSDSLYYLGSFRLLMIASRLNNLTAVGKELWFQFKLLFPFMLSTLFIWYLFAVVGTQIFMGTFHQCIDDLGNFADREIVKTKEDCLNLNWTWQKAGDNFDSVPEAYLSLFYVTTRNGWLVPIHQAQDIVEDNMQPERGANPSSILYFMAFLLFGLLFPFYTMCGVLLNNFRKKDWIGAFKHCSKIKHTEKEKATLNTPLPPETHFSKKFYNCTTHAYFELWVCFTVIVDIIAFAIGQSTFDDEHYARIKILRNIILVSYIMEFLAKLITFRLSFFKNFMNIILLITILISISELIVKDLVLKYDLFGRTLRLLRILHLLCVDKIWKYRFDNLRSLRRAIFESFYPVLNIFMFYGLIFCSYAMLGSLIFGTKDFSSYHSITTLFKIVTISGWAEIYHRISYPQECPIENFEQDCRQTYPIFGIIFMSSLIALTVFHFVNMYLVLILEIVKQIRQARIPNSETLSQEAEDEEGKRTEY